MMTKHRYRKCRERGVALITVVGLLLVVLIFAGGMMAQLAMEVQSVKQHGNASRALAAADAGVHAMVAAIQDNAVQRLAPPPSISYTYPEAIGPTTTSYTASVDPHNWVSGGLNYYLIFSTGTYDNGVQTRVKRQVAAIVKAQPYSEYASFSINEVNEFGRAVWYRQDQFFDGPVYSGGPMRIDYNDTKGPIFGNTVLTGNTPVWNDQNDGLPPDSGDWGSIIQGGQNNFTINPVGLALPQPSDNLALMSEAYQGDDKATDFPTVNNGVYMNKLLADTPGGGSLTTGIYINANGGNVFIDGSSGPNSETFTISSGVKNFGPPWTIVLNFGSPGSTTVTHGGSPVTYTGVPSGQPGAGNNNLGNGAIFVNGDILFGKNNPNVTLHGDYTFATPDYAGNANEIYINGDFKYFDKSVDKAALWADNINMNTAASNIEVDASIIAGFPGEPWRSGYFKNAFCGRFTCSKGDQGTLTIFGGLIENSRGALGVWIGNSHFGFSRKITYDQRLAASPPPFNPTTGAFNIVAWDDLGTVP